MGPRKRMILNHLQSCATRLALPWQCVPDLEYLLGRARKYHRMLELECNDSERYQWAAVQQGRIEAQIKERCEALKIYFYLQTDCRGNTLFLSTSPLTDNDYHNGVCLSAI